MDSTLRSFEDLFSICDESEWGREQHAFNAVKNLILVPILNNDGKTFLDRFNP